MTKSIADHLFSFVVSGFYRIVGARVIYRPALDWQRRLSSVDVPSKFDSISDIFENRYRGASILSFSMSFAAVVLAVLGNI